MNCGVCEEVGRFVVMVNEPQAATFSCEPHVAHFVKRALDGGAPEVVVKRTPSGLDDVPVAIEAVAVAETTDGVDE